MSHPKKTIQEKGLLLTFVTLAILSLTTLISRTELAVSNAQFSDVLIKARGTSGNERISLTINEKEVEQWQLSQVYEDYVFTPETPLALNEVSVNYINEAFNQDVRVDYIKVNGQRYDTEHSSTISTGTWSRGQGCTEGNKKSEWLHCNGSLTYNVPSGTVIGNVQQDVEVVTVPLQLTKEPTVTNDATTAQIIWGTSDKSQGYVEYGPTQNLGQETTRELSFRFDEHVQKISGLSPDTSYYYRVVATSLTDEVIRSDIKEFKTDAVPIGGGSEVSVAEDWPIGTSNDLPLAGIFYGVHEVGVGVQNAAVALESSRRFRAQKTGTLTSVRYQNRVPYDKQQKQRCETSNQPHYCYCEENGIKADQCSYAIVGNYMWGNGGLIEIQLQADDGNGFPDGKVLGRTEKFVPRELFDKGQHFPKLNFISRPFIKAGGIYHLVFHNYNPPVKCPLGKSVPLNKLKTCEKDKGAIALDGIRLAPGSEPRNTGKWGPYMGDMGGADLFRYGTSKSAWKYHQTSLAYYEIGYDDGQYVGESYTSYYTSWTPDREPRGTLRTIEGNTRGRQLFTVRDATRRVNGVWVNHGHTRSANGKPLIVQLKNQSGTVLASGSIPASSWCRAAAKKGSTFGEKRCLEWGYVDFQKVADLIEGKTYSLELSADAGAGFYLNGYNALRDLGLDFKDRNNWLGAFGQVSKDGGRTWSKWSALSETDLPVLFTIDGMPRQFK